MNAQYAGGIGRGMTMAAFLPPAVEGICSGAYSGGIGRGQTMAAFLPPVVEGVNSGAYTGGIGRGQTMAAFLPPVVEGINSGAYSGGIGRGQTMAAFVPPPKPPMLPALTMRLFLDGPYNTASGLMKDDLRLAGLVPFMEPYSALGYIYVGGGGESTSAPVLANTGATAVVDWVLIELRDADAPAVVVASRSALVTRQGLVMDRSGEMPLRMNVEPGNYLVAVQHRNHLGAMTAAPVTLSSIATYVDFTSTATAVHGTNARKSVSGANPAQVLWAGDVNFDGRIKYTGSVNDRDPILEAIGGTVPTNTVDGYLPQDVNMDGTVRYTGSNNDRDPILQNIGGTVPTSAREAQLP